VLALLLLAGFAAYRYRGPLASWTGNLMGRLAGRGGAGRDAGAGRGTDGAGAGSGSGSALAVGIGDGGFATIGEALAQARPGDTVDVAPGRYRERIVLRSGVSLVSRVPRGAVIEPPPAAGNGGGGPAVLANGVRGARLAGFRVAGTPPAPWSAALRLDGSEVVIEETEVTGATGAAIEIRGADRSTLRYCYVHHNAGAGILVAGDAAPRLLANLITGNGARPGAPAPGVEVRDAAAPLLAGNRIEGNGGPGVSLPVPERVDEVWRWNSFGALPREQAVRVAGGPSGTAASAPPRRAVAARSLAAHPATAAGAGPSGAAAGAAAAASHAPRRQR